MFNKEQAKAKFDREHPEWQKVKRSQRVIVTVDMIEKIVSLYPDTNNMAISEIVDIPYQQLGHIIQKLRSKGVVLNKELPTFHTSFEKAFNEYNSKL